MLYNTKNSKKYLLLCHLIFVTKYRRKVFNIKELDSYIKFYFKNLRKEFLILEQETDQNHIHFMIQYPPTLSISMIVRCLKQKSTIDIWRRYDNLLYRFYWNERTLWSDGYFVCSIGDSNAETIKRYIREQG